MKHWKLLVVFALGISIALVMNLGRSTLTNCPDKFHEVRLFEMVEFGWTTIFAVVIGVLVQQSMSRKTRGVELLKELLGSAKTATESAYIGFQDYCANRTVENQNRTLRLFKQLRRAIHHSQRYLSKVSGLETAKIEHLCGVITTALRNFQNTATDDPFGTNTPYTDQELDVIHDSKHELVSALLDLEVEITIQ